MTTREIVDEVNKITKILTAPTSPPVDKVCMGYIALENLRGKLIRKLVDELGSATVADEGPGHAQIRADVTLDTLLNMVGRNNLELTIAPATRPT